MIDKQRKEEIKHRFFNDTWFNNTVISIENNMVNGGYFMLGKEFYDSLGENGEHIYRKKTYDHIKLLKLYEINDKTYTNNVQVKCAIPEDILDFLKELCETQKSLHRL